MRAVGWARSRALGLRSEHRHGAGLEPGWCCDAPPQLANRHSDFVDIGAAAAEFGSEIIQAADGNDPAVVKRVQSLSPDVLFVIGWSQICRQPMMETGRLGTIGYHPAPLPRLRGRAPIPWTILLDEPITAGTLFWIDEGTDTGPILAQHFFHVARTRRRLLYTVVTCAHLSPCCRMPARARRRNRSPRSPWTIVLPLGTRRTPDDGRIDWRTATSVAANPRSRQALSWAFTNDGASGPSSGREN